MTDRDLTVLDTLPKLLRDNAAHWPNEVALREKDFGIWNAMTWAQVNDRAAAFARGFKALGLAKGSVVGLIGDNRPDWVIAEVAAHALGAMSLGIYRDALDQEVEYLTDYADIHVIWAEDEEQVDKLLNLGDRIPSVTHIVYDDPRGMRKYEDARLISVEDFLAKGAAAFADDPGVYDRWVDARSGSDLAILCTTSGTTANPKLAMLTGGALVNHCAVYLKADPKGPTDEYVSVLPLPWIMEQIYAVGKWLLSRMTVNFVEEPETMMADLREIGPTFVLLAPRVWEGLAADVRSRMMDASPFKRFMFDLCMKWGMAGIDRGRPSKLAYWLLFRWLADRLGFTRLRSAATGGAALGPETFKFFIAMGVPLRQLYGQTELLGAYTIHTDDDVDFDTVGVGFEGVEIKIANPDPDGVGEIVTRHPNMFAGYYKNEEATKADFDAEGWMHTGDAGFFNKARHLVVIDRVKDLATTSHGHRFSPQFIENKLKFSPFVAEAVILGDDKPYLSAIICIRFPIVSKWAEKNRISFTTYSDLAAKETVYEQIRSEVEGVNKTLPEHQRIARFLLLYKELDADDGELTRTRKVRRSVISDKYGGIIDAIYGDQDRIPIDTTIQFQDGTTQRIRTTLKVVTLIDPAPARPAEAAE